MCPASGGISLYTGIDLFYTDIVSDSDSVHHEALAHIMQINYCRAGQVVWKTQGGSTIFLNPGDFSAFYDQLEKLKLPYQRIKILELLLYLAEMEPAPQNRLTEYQSRQIEIVREIHDHLLRHMEQVTKMLRDTDRSLAEITQAVDYDSQSKFTTVFKGFIEFCQESTARIAYESICVQPFEFTWPESTDEKFWLFFRMVTLGSAIFSMLIFGAFWLSFRVKQVPFV